MSRPFPYHSLPVNYLLLQPPSAPEPVRSVLPRPIPIHTKHQTESSLHMTPHHHEVSKEVGGKHLLKPISIQPVRLGHDAFRSGQHVQQLPGSQQQELVRDPHCQEESTNPSTSQVPHSFSSKGSTRPCKKGWERSRVWQLLYLQVPQY